MICGRSLRHHAMTDILEDHAMTTPDVRKDPEARTLSLSTDLAVPVERAWQLWADPRQLEGWWGPPTYPATVVEHDLTPGGRVTYFMTGPEGDEHHGWWQVLAVDAPRRLELQDGFADDDGAPVEDLPVSTMTVTLTELDDGRTRMVLESAFATVEAMQQLESMGAVEGMLGAMSQIDGVLARAGS